MAQNQNPVMKPLTPDILGEKYERPFIDFSKHVPWLRGKGFQMHQPPRDQKILVRKENK